MTTDTKASASFYERVVGWHASAAGMGDPGYMVFSTDKAPVAGLMGLPPAGGSGPNQPCWTGYVGVDDVDAFAARVKAAGGAVHRGPEDIVDVGRFAVVADPQGAVFILFTPSRDGEPSYPMDEIGRIGWHELHAANLERALAFYSELFGWTEAGRHDMGPMGPYAMIATDGGTFGGAIAKSPDSPVPFWVYYFNVDGIEAATTRVTGGGGSVVVGPLQVPGGSWIVHCIDPQGAAFSLASTKP
jgi:predicted enzyme related to lactoylglutathione lyase